MSNQLSVIPGQVTPERWGLKDCPVCEKRIAIEPDTPSEFKCQWCQTSLGFNESNQLVEMVSPEIEKLINDIRKKAIEIDEMVPGPVGTATFWQLLVSRIKWEWYCLKEQLR